MTPSIQKNSCVICAQRKVKCDKSSPCSNCSRSRSECIYRAPATSQRHRKRPADEDLLSKISEYEELLSKNNIKFQPLDNSWIPSPLEKLISRPQKDHTSTHASVQALSEPEPPLEVHDSEQALSSDVRSVQSEAARLWSGLPKEVCSLIPFYQR